MEKHCHRLCDILRENFGPVYRYVRIDELRLYDMPSENKEARRHLQDGPELTLTQALRERKLSGMAKVRLVYHLAKSFWQYYDSEMMCLRWTSDTIHFMPQGRDHATYYGSEPMLSMPFESGAECEREIHNETLSSTHGVLHRAPRILALGTILAHVLQRNYNQPESVTTDLPWKALLNTELVNSKAILESETWPDLDNVSTTAREIIRHAVAACFDVEKFKKCDCKDKRREIVRDSVLAKLAATAGPGLKDDNSTWDLTIQSPFDTCAAQVIGSKGGFMSAAIR